jgi:hypothetical protein
VTQEFVDTNASVAVADIRKHIQTALKTVVNFNITNTQLKDAAAKNKNRKTNKTNLKGFIVSSSLFGNHCLQTNFIIRNQSPWI